MKCRENQRSIRAFAVRALSFSAVTALTLNPALSPVWASDYRAATAPVAVDGQMNARFLALGIGKSIVIDLPRDIKDVLVADPKIANAVVRSAQRAYIIGAAVGQTNIVFFDASGQQIAAYDIAVKRDLNGVRAALKQTLPNADIQIEGIGDGVMLTGSASSQVEAQQANDLAARLVGAPEKVVNDRRARPRSGDAQGHCGRGEPEYHQATRRRSLGVDVLRHRSGQVQQQQSIHGAGPQPGRSNTAGASFGSQHSVRLCESPRDGERRCRPNACRTKLDGDLR